MNSLGFILRCILKVQINLKIERNLHKSRLLLNSNKKKNKTLIIFKVSFTYNKKKQSLFSYHVIFNVDPTVLPKCYWKNRRRSIINYNIVSNINRKRKITKKLFKRLLKRDAKINYKKFYKNLRQ